MIDITDVNMVEFVKKVYELSRPQGMGLMHFQPGAMSDEDAQSLIHKDGTVSMDYVSGRACKMCVRKDDGRLFISDQWYDHSDAHLEELLEHCGVSVAGDVKPSDHGHSCNCDDCRVKRGEGKLDSKVDFNEAMKARKNGTAFKIKQL